MGRGIGRKSEQKGKRARGVVSVDSFACLFSVVIEHSVTLEAFPDVIREKTNTAGEREREREHVRWRGGGRRSEGRRGERGRAREGRRQRGREAGSHKSRRISGRSRRKVVIRIALICVAVFLATRLRLLQEKGKSLDSDSSTTPQKQTRMEWNEVDLVQEFTVEGQCSKIKVRSCRITWDSLQVNTNRRWVAC